MRFKIAVGKNCVTDEYVCIIMCYLKYMSYGHLIVNIRNGLWFL